MSGDPAGTLRVFELDLNAITKAAKGATAKGKNVAAINASKVRRTRHGTALHGTSFLLYGCGIHVCTRVYICAHFRVAVSTASTPPVDQHSGTAV